MPRAGKQIAVSALLLILFCVLCRFFLFNTFHVYIPLEENTSAEAPDLAAEEPSVARLGTPVRRGGYVKVPVIPGQRGETDLLEGNSGRIRSVLKVGRLSTVYDYVTGDFTGDSAVLIAVTLFWLLTGAIMLWHFLRAKGPAFYSYATIYYAGFFLFALSSGIVMAQVTIRHLLQPAVYHMNSALDTISGVSARFMMITSPLMLLFAGAMAVSNIALLRHERPRPQNVLGLGVSLLLALGEVLGWFLFTRDFMGSEWEGRLFDTLVNTYATVFVYCQCMLAGAAVCGVKAARHEPERDKDFIVILGCWFRPDGSLPPLLKGRADRAVAFWEQQKAETGREAVFIPTGGQGRDEPMPEGEAIRRYLLSRDIPDRLILPETRAENTFQNMAFSGDIIRETLPEGKTVFATTNYHVFRSGVWAAQAGLPAEGIGSRTKWWFWPNAFMRETAGLLQRRWRQELALLAALLVFFGLLSMTLG